jgi:hypothetical protein
VQRVDLLAAAVFAPLAQQLRDARKRRGEGSAHGLGGTGALRGGERLGEQQLEPLGADALAPAGHRGAIARLGVLDMGLAAAELDVGAVEEARADGCIGEAVPMLDQVQPDHEARRQSRPADTVAGERAEGGSEAIPVDQASEPHQGMLRIDQVHERRAVMRWTAPTRHLCAKLVAAEASSERSRPP